MQGKRSPSELPTALETDRLFVSRGLSGTVGLVQSLGTCVSLPGQLST